MGERPTGPTDTESTCRSLTISCDYCTSIVEGESSFFLGSSEGVGKSGCIWDCICLHAIHDRYWPRGGGILRHQFAPFNIVFTVPIRIRSPTPCWEAIVLSLGYTLRTSFVICSATDGEIGALSSYKAGHQLAFGRACTSDDKSESQSQIPKLISELGLHLPQLETGYIFLGWRIWGKWCLGWESWADLCHILGITKAYG